jgi:hypothetical protein
MEEVVLDTPALPTIVMSKEDIAQTYKSALDSVDLIERYVTGTNAPALLTEEQYNDDIKRNVDHLTNLLTKDYWTDEDLTPFESAVSLGNNYLNK